MQQNKTTVYVWSLHDNTYPAGEPSLHVTLSFVRNLRRNFGTSLTPQSWELCAISFNALIKLSVCPSRSKCSKSRLISLEVRWLFSEYECTVSVPQTAYIHTNITQTVIVVIRVLYVMTRCLMSSCSQTF